MYAKGDKYVHTHTHKYTHLLFLVMATYRFRSPYAILFYDVRMLKCSWLFIVGPMAKPKELSRARCCSINFRQVLMLRNIIEEETLGI